LRGQEEEKHGRGDGAQNEERDEDDSENDDVGHTPSLLPCPPTSLQTLLDDRPGLDIGHIILDALDYDIAARQPRRRARRLRGPAREEVVPSPVELEGYSPPAGTASDWLDDASHVPLKPVARIIIGV
jgi:hypothetical protein